MTTYRKIKSRVPEQLSNSHKGQSKMETPEKLATWDTQDEEKRDKNTTQYVLDTTIRKQTQIT